MSRWEGADTKKDYSFKSTGKKKNKYVIYTRTHAYTDRQNGINQFEGEGDRLCHWPTANCKLIWKILGIDCHQGR